MSHFALRMGHFFHVHPFGLGHLVPSGILKWRIPALVVPRWEPSRSPSDDLSYLGLCQEVPREEGAAELDRLSLTQREGESAWGLDEIWLSLP